MNGISACLCIISIQHTPPVLNNSSVEHTLSVCWPYIGLTAFNAAAAAAAAVVVRNNCLQYSASSVHFMKRLMIAFVCRRNIIIYNNYTAFPIIYIIQASRPRSQWL